MSAGLIVLHTAIAIVGMIFFIVRVRIDPAVILIIGSIYLGVATGLGASRTMELIATGFGDLMAEVGLIIGFGVLLGSFLAATGAIQKIVDAILALVGREKSPYAISLSTALVFPAIYFDVTLVILGSMTRSLATRTGMSIAPLGAALAAGLETGLLFVPPGVAALAVAGALQVPVGTMFLFGILVGVPTVILTTFLCKLLLGTRFWNPAKDEEDIEEVVGDDSLPEGRELPPLYVAAIPILIPLALILLGTVSGPLGVESPVIELLGNPVVALLLGLLAAYVLASRVLTAESIEKAGTDGLKTSGLILLFTGVAGSLGAVIAETGIQGVIEDAFSATSLSPLLLVWLVGALLRIAQGSATVAALAGVGIVAPIVTDLGATPVLVALAAGSGAAFGAHVSDNSFWLFRSLLGVSTRGTFKSYTLGQSTMSVVSLALILVLSTFV